MDFFAVYYKEKFAGMKFITFKKVKDHPKQIMDILNNSGTVGKAQKFINH